MFSFRSKINAGFIPAIIFLVLIAGFSYRNTEALVENAQSVAHTHEVTETIQNMLSEVKDLETGQRGFLLTGANDYLEPFEKALATLDETLDRLQKLTADNPREQQRIAEIRDLKNQKIDELKHTIQLRREKGLNAALEIVRNNSGKVIMDKIRIVASEMKIEEEGLLKIRNDKTNESTQLTTLVIVVGGILSVLILLGATVVVNLAETKRVTASQQLEDQNRIRKGLLQLGEVMAGEQSVASLAKNVIETIANFIRAQVGAIYLSDDTGMLKWAGGYAFQQNKNTAPLEFQFGDGLIGQAAAQKKLISFDNLPNHHLKVRSATIDEMNPANLFVVPFLHEGKVKGVTEFGTSSALSESDLEYLKLGFDNVAVAFNSAQIRARITALLEETQSQAEELQVQQEELRTANEELHAKTHELESQQEELRQANEELEEQRTALEAQTKRLESNNREIQKAQSVIEEKARDVERASQYKSEFLANMSHELRTPLNSILLLSKSMSENDEQNLTVDQEEICRTIYTSGVDLLSLINDILDLSKVEAGKLDIHSAEINISELSKTMQNLFQPQVQNKGLAFKVEISAQCPKYVFTDRLRLEQILKNFLSNAIKFTHSGVVTLTFDRPDAKLDLSSSGLARDSAIAISVQDTGIGIPDNMKNRVFEAFEQIDSTVSRKYGGAGLGLTISKNLAELLGGEIQLESASGRGSRFVVILPEHLAKDGPTDRAVKIPQPAPSASIPHSAKQKTGAHGIEDDRKHLSERDKTILIVEDDPNFAKILYGYCQKRGFKCLLAGDGESALTDAKEFHPSAVILDLRLPGISGLAVLEYLKNDSKTRHIPVHVMSVDEKITDVLKMGAIGFLNKPATQHEIENAIQKIDSKISNKSRNVLIVEDRAVERESILKLIGTRDVKCEGVASGTEALARLKTESFDCMVLDLKLPDMSGFELLEKIEKEKPISVPPIIVYTGRDLTLEEINRLQGFSQTIIVKGVHSQERLLNEVTLFLHRVEADLPKEQQQILEKVRHREEIFEGKNLLVVDDDMRNVFALRSIFARKGFEISVAKTGKEAIEKLNAQQPTIDIVLMDIMMPEMDGYEAMRQIRQDKRFEKLPIIALTAKAMETDRAKCIDAGANDYLSKPIDMDHLLSLLRVWLSR
jgi:CheY-like chemotaxis protein/CHASE3 domain sensor protein/putative methionine-R-sulfoxide reductase with GAF domain